MDNCNCECCRFIVDNNELIKDELKSVCDKLESWAKINSRLSQLQRGWKYSSNYGNKDEIYQFGIYLMHTDFFHKNAKNILSGGMNNDKMKSYTISITKYKDNIINAVVSPTYGHAHITNLLINEAECNNGDDLAKMIYECGFLPMSPKIQYPDCFLTSTH